MKDKLEFKILGTGFAILLVGIFLTVFFVYSKQKHDVYNLAEQKLYSVSEIILNDIEKTMLTGKSEITRLVLSEYGKLKTIKSVEVFDSDGREVFKPGAPAREADALKRVAAAGSPLLIRDEKAFVLYRPLLNTSECRDCHAGGSGVLGAVKVAVSVLEETGKVKNFMLLMAGGSLFGSVFLGFFFWFILNRLIIAPVKDLEDAAKRMAQGDLSFKTGLKYSNDEIGKLRAGIKDSLYAISGILGKVKEISRRIAEATEKVEKDSDKAVGFAEIETEAVADISVSVEELNAAISEIAESVDGLAASVEQTAASSEEIAVSIESIFAVASELSVGVEATGSSIEELSATLKDVAGGAKELAHVSEETITAIEEIISSIKEVERRAKESSSLSGKVTAEASTLGLAAIEKTTKGMDRIKSSFEKTAGVIKKLGGRSEEIGKILTVIDEITEQTTLLALNAAILAAQAGEKGKGFSVVADEIKNLADRTGVSTQEISALIAAVQLEVKTAADTMKEGLKSVEEGITFTTEAGQTVKKMIEGMKQSSDVALSIERVTAEQARSAKHVSESVEKVRGMMGQMEKATMEQSKGISLIIDAAERMKDASLQVKNTTEQQAESSRQISQAIDVISEKSQQIASAINEQKAGSSQIWRSVEKIRDLPAQNRELSFGINRTVRDLLRDADLMNTEIERFKLSEEGVRAVLRLGIVPLQSPAEMYRRFTPLADYLSEELGVKVELRVASNFEAAVRELGQGKTEFCYMTPSTYIQARRDYGAKVLVKALREGKPFHHAVIIARQGGSIKTVRDIKGRSFAFGDQSSTSSHIVPRAMLLEEGIELKDLSFYNYMGHHDDVARAVVKGEFDAGGVMEAVAYKYKDQGLALIRFSPEIPEFNIAAHNADEQTSQRIKMAFIELGANEPSKAAVLKSIDQNYTGFAEAAPGDYDSIMDIMSKIGLI